MQPKLPLFPEQASTVAGQVDALYLFLVLITTFFSLLIALLILFFAIKYKRTPGRKAEQTLQWKAGGRVSPNRNLRARLH